MKINVSRGFVTELLKDMIYPEVCPVCKAAIRQERRLRLHMAEEAASEARMRYGNGTEMNRADSSNAVRSKSKAAVGGNAIHSNSSAGISGTDFRVLYEGLICDSCLEGLNFVREPYCCKCGKPLTAAGRADNLCSDCRSHERSFVQNRALAVYDECMREIMADIKYNGKKEYLRLFGVLAADRLGSWIRQCGINCIIPVPVHSSRLLKRGYNQSELLCEYTGELLGIPVEKGIVIRNKKTAAQKELNADERLLNLQSAFSMAAKLRPGTNALIIDDIYTTGSTMEACTECLREAGAQHVYGLTICIGEDNPKGKQ